MPSPRDRTPRGYVRTAYRVHHPLRPADPGSDTWHRLSWDDDPYARVILRTYGRPMRLEEIGEWMGLSRERVRQIEAQALRKLQHMATRGKIDREELRELFIAWRAG